MNESEALTKIASLFKLWGAELTSPEAIAEGVEIRRAYHEKLEAGLYEFQAILIAEHDRLKAQVAAFEAIPAKLELKPASQRRIFEWLQEGDIRMKGDYYASSLTGWMCTIPEDMIGKPVKNREMPVYRPLIVEGFEPLTDRDTYISHTPGELRYPGAPVHKT